MKKKFYKVVFKCEVLVDSEDTFESMAKGLWRMDEVVEEIKYGNSSGSFYVESAQEVTPKEMAKLLQDQNSDPEFFNLDETGEELDDGE